MKKNKTNTWFTLVELIVVITILAILWTIAFISLQWYSKSSRDSVRISDVSNMKTSLELFHLNAGKYPLPDENVIVDYDTETLWYQWQFWKNVVSQLSRNLSEIPTDPLTDKKYIYSVAWNKNEFEILNLLEWDIVLNNISQTNAANLVVTPRIDWTYNGVFIKTSNYIVPVPSIINSEVNWTDVTLDTDISIKSQIINWWENIPNLWNVNYNTWALTNLTLHATGTIDKDSTDAEKLSVYQAIYDTYTWTTLANDWVIQIILNQTTDAEKIAITKTIVLNNTTTVASSSSSSSGWWFWDWRDLDSNCDLADITIWTQTWAWCNSTLWIGTWAIEYTNETYCYDYKWANLWDAWDCGAWNYWDSNDKESDYYTVKWANSNTPEDIWVNNIWGKLYIWSEASKTDWTWPCRNGYSLPTDEDWYDLEVALGSTNRSNNWAYSWIQDWWLSDWLGWKNHSDLTKNDSNNIVEALQLPLSGYRNTDGVTFITRGHNTNLWSSTQYDATYARGRCLHWNYSTVYRYYRDKSNGFSVRCIKD